MAVEHPDHRHVVVLAALLTAAPIIWSVHFMVVYLAVEAGCTGDGPGLDRFDPPVPTVVTLVGTAVAALACVGTAVWAYRLWQANRSGGQAHAQQGQLASLAFAGFLLSLLGIIAVLLVGLPALILPACAP
jgi:hypothetical protein